MHRRNIVIASVVALACVAGSAPAAFATSSASKPITVRIEGANKTLLAQTTVTLKKFTRSGHSCWANSAAAALNAATKGKWVASWSDSYGFFVSSILGETDNSTKAGYWEFFVNGVSASAGICDPTLAATQIVKPGDQILFAATADYSALPIDIVKAKTSGDKVFATVDYYTAAGKLKPLKGATVKLNGKSGTTNAKGVVTLTVKKTSGTLTASETGYIRDELALKKA